MGIKQGLNIYDSNDKKQNLLCNTSDFEHIFGDDSNLQNKIQSCLMMIEKDFVATRGFPHCLQDLKIFLERFLLKFQVK